MIVRRNIRIPLEKKGCIIIVLSLLVVVLMCSRPCSQPNDIFHLFPVQLDFFYHTDMYCFPVRGIAPLSRLRSSVLSLTKLNRFTFI